MNEFARRQFNQAKGIRPHVTCKCGQTMPLRFAYKCLYCGEYFCQSCAEEHFGKTLEEYRKEKFLEAVE
jgi:predicted nucleic acid binding AN1-type Zn finger protein